MKLNRPIYLSILKNQTFQGLTGPIHINANGDRLYTNFDLINLNTREALNVSRNSGAIIVGTVYSNGTVDLVQPIRYAYGGEKATDPVVFSITQTSLSTHILLAALCSISVGCVLICHSIIILFRTSRAIKASSPVLLHVVFFGLLLLSLSIAARILEASSTKSQDSPAPCVADLFLTNIAYTLIVAALLAKNYRIFKVRIAYISSMLSNHG